MTSSSKAPQAVAEMLIRKPVAQVFAAFTEPEQVSKFWLARSSGKLVPGAKLRWDFIIEGAHTDVLVKEVVPNERILIEWDEGATVEWQFTARGDNTFVRIINSGFRGTAEEIANQAIDAMGGFTLVLCELKAQLEHGIVLNLGPDKFPDAKLAR